MNSANFLNEMRRLFWTTLFQEKKVASQLHSISRQGEQVCFTNVGQFGLVNFQCRPASYMGDNFMSDTFIVTATAQDGQSFRGFVKILPRNSIMLEMALESKAYEREIAMYSVVFDRLYQTRYEAGLSEEDLPLYVPQIYYVHLKDKNQKKVANGLDTCVLMEDLTAAGFHMTDKHKGCDDEQVRLALRSLANYHALGIATLKKWIDHNGQVVLPRSLHFLTESMAFIESIPPEQFAQWYKPIVTRFRAGYREELAIWMEKLLDNLQDFIVVDSLKSMGPLTCISHGDYWCNNMLYKYEEVNGFVKPTECKMIDFQISRISHPVSDILYYIYTSTIYEVRRKHMTSWLTFYFRKLTAALKLLDAGVPNYTLDDFMAEYKRRSPMWMLSAFAVMVFTLDSATVTGFQHSDSESGEVAELLNDKSDLSEEENMEKLLKSMMNATVEAHDPKVSERIIKLAEEVKQLTDTH